MKLKWLGPLSQLFALASLSVVPAVAGAACPALLDHSFPALKGGKPVPLCQYAGKVILVVNTASQCGFTGQYEGLEKLYERMKDKGLVILGFPANDFGAQEPGSNEEIADFCQANYGVSFPMFAKTVVKGSGANPFHRRLAEITGSTPKWNFHKYLINRDGSQVVAYTSLTKPDDRDLLKKIDEFLNPR